LETLKNGGEIILDDDNDTDDTEGQAKKKLKTSK
jgi:glycosyltransferase involved in cell wall biosynthesis